MELDDAIRARHIVDEKMQVALAQSSLAGRAKTWALGLKLHDPYVFGSLDVFKSLLRQLLNLRELSSGLALNS